MDLFMRQCLCYTKEETSSSWRGRVTSKSVRQVFIDLTSYSCQGYGVLFIFKSFYSLIFLLFLLYLLFYFNAGVHATVTESKNMFSSLNKEDNIIKNIAKEIVRDCGQAGLSVSLDLAIYLIHLKFLIPVYGFKEDKVMSRNFTQTIIDECVRDFLADSVWINTLRLQTYSENNLVNRENIKKEHEENVWKRSKPLLKEILDMDPTDKDGRDKMYKKMVLFTIVFSGLGNATFNSVLREAQAALQSIFKYSDLERFIFHSDAVKEDQMLEFARIAGGIRLFNKDCQKGGENIDDLPLILTQASQITKDRVSNTLEQLMKRIVKLTTAFDEVYSLQTRRMQVHDDDLEYNLPPDFTASDLDKMKRIFFMIREHEYYMKKLLLVVEDTISSIVKLIEQFRETLLQLHDTVRYRSAVPTVQVYPLFIVLSNIWEEMQKEAAVLTEINSFMVYLHSFNKYEEQTQLEIVLSAHAGRKEKLDVLPVNVEKIDRGQLHPGVTVISSTDESLLSRSQFSGYCAWTLAVTEGLLIPGNALVGFLQYKRCLYSFSSMLLAFIWGKNPDHFIAEVYKAARAKLELVKMLNLYDILYEIKTDLLLEAEPEGTMRRNVEIQTELHPIKSHIDRNYTFSLWEHKRRALQLSHIINYQTSSQQTVNHSHFRASIALQVSPSKCQSTQTKRDSSCNHSGIGSYLFGLRGFRENKFQALDLTRPVDEELPEKSLTDRNCQ